MLQHKWLFRNTANKKGRNIIISPENSEFKFITYARIILDNEISSETAQNLNSETMLLVLNGEGEVIVGNNIFQVSRLDGVYIPVNEEFSIRTNSSLDIIEASAETTQSFPTNFVKYNEIKSDPTLSFEVGSQPSKRKITKILAENVHGSRLLMGITQSELGNWTSWPPHEHAATQEELYLFVDMPAPAFGTQYVYHSLENPELVAPVYNNDAVSIVEGYHPNVAAPGFSINFVWVLCSLEETTYRKLGGVNVQPEYLMETGLK